MKIVVFDDDPTGSQTVNDCPLVLKWDHETLLKGLQSKSNLLFILANTRSLSEYELRIRLEEICFNLSDVIKNPFFKNEEFIFVSRGDSTLRGHNFLEPYLINKFLGPFDATFHIPAFIEGNRVTKYGLHFVNNIPAHKTIFAKDQVFGYQTNDIKKLLYQKSNSKLNLSDINNLYLDDLSTIEIKRGNSIYEELRNFKNNSQVIVDTTTYSELDKFANILITLIKDKRFLFRTSASFISSISNSRKNTKKHIFYSQLRRQIKGRYLKGLVVVGSIVDLTTNQLYKLLEINSCRALEINVEEFFKISRTSKQEQINSLRKIIVQNIRELLAKSLIPVLYTSREMIFLQDKNELIKFQQSLSIFISGIIQEIKNEIGYLISKGGITSNTILSEGFCVDSVYLEGQIFTGISVVNVDISSTEKIPVVTFPGNIGDENMLVKVLEVLENKEIS